MNKIPSLGELLAPTVAALKELGGSGRLNEVADRVGANLKLSEELLAEVTPTGDLSPLLTTTGLLMEVRCKDEVDSSFMT